MRAPAVLMSEVTGYKLSKLGSNNIDSQNTFLHFFFIFKVFLISDEH